MCVSVLVYLVVHVFISLVLYGLMGSLCLRLCSCIARSLFMYVAICFVPHLCVDRCFVRSLVRCVCLYVVR